MILHKYPHAPTAKSTGIQGTPNPGQFLLTINFQSKIHTQEYLRALTCLGPIRVGTDGALAIEAERGIAEVMSGLGNPLGLEETGSFEGGFSNLNCYEVSRMGCVTGTVGIFLLGVALITTNKKH